MGMKQILLMLAAVVLVGCVKKAEPFTDPIVEGAVRESLEKPEGEFTANDLEKVTGLDLSRTKITDAGLKEVARMQKIIILDLTATKITDAGLKEVAKLQSLESLWMNGTKITDAGLKEVAKLQSLERLYLLATQTTKAGVAELREALPNCEISGPY